MTPGVVVATGLEALLNRYLGMSPEVWPKVAALNDRVIAVNLAGFNLQLYILPGADRIQIVDNHHTAPDVVIRATPFALTRLAAGATDTINLGVDIQGDLHLAKAFQDLLGSVEIDWEEELSGWLGDTLAHRLGVATRGSLAWGGKALDTLFGNIAEYLQEERRELPSSAVMERFLDEVDKLRSDLDRLEVRVDRLRQTLAEDR